MFLKNPRLLLKSNSFRLITWYTLFFILSSLVINIYAYTVISSFIYEQSRKEIEEDIADLAKIYQAGRSFKENSQSIYNRYHSYNPVCLFRRNIHCRPRSQPDSTTYKYT